jgi:hypothetical protein
MLAILQRSLTRNCLLDGLIVMFFLYKKSFLVPEKFQ